MEIIAGRIVNVGEKGLTIYAPYDNHDRLILRQYDVVRLGLPDGRFISPDQQKKAHALIGEIAEWAGEYPEDEKKVMKLDFIVNRMQSLEKKMFSLSDCDMTTAREFITYLIDFMIEHEVPAKFPLYEQCEDITRYVFTCLMHKTCCVCGQTHADLHHVDRVGMGRNRDEVFQLGMRVMSLCRECHQEFHQVGDKAFFSKYHLTPIPLTREIGKKYSLTKKNLGSLEKGA